MSSTKRTTRKRNADPTDASNDDEMQLSNAQQQQLSDSGASQDLDEYTMKRLRNNAAVNRTRQKKRMEQEHTSQKVKELREENAQLERTLDTMRRELALLKEMVVVCAAKGDQQEGGSK